MELGIREEDFNKYNIALESLNDIASFVDKLDSKEEVDAYTVNAVVAHTEQCAIDLGMKFVKDPDVVISQEGLLSSAKEAVINAAKYIRDMLIKLYEYVMKKLRAGGKGTKEAAEKAKQRAKDVDAKAKQFDETLAKAKKHAAGIDKILGETIKASNAGRVAGMTPAQFKEALKSASKGPSKKPKKGKLTVVAVDATDSIKVVKVDANKVSEKIDTLVQEINKVEKQDAAKAKKHKSDETYTDRYKKRKAMLKRIRDQKKDILKLSFTTGVQISTYRNHKWHLVTDQFGKVAFDLDFEKPLNLEDTFDLILTKAEKNLKFVESLDLLAGTKAFSANYRKFLEDYSTRDNMKGIEDAMRNVIHEAWGGASSRAIGIIGKSANVAYTKDPKGLPRVEPGSPLSERKAVAESAAGKILCEEPNMNAEKLKDLFDTFESPLAKVSKSLDDLEKLTSVPSMLELGEDFTTPNPNLSPEDLAKYNMYYRVPGIWAGGFARAVADIVREITDVESFMTDVLGRLSKNV